jgi:hypothetical protein
MGLPIAHTYIVHSNFTLQARQRLHTTCIHAMARHVTLSLRSHVLDAYQDATDAALSR